MCFIEKCTFTINSSDKYRKGVVAGCNGALIDRESEFQERGVNIPDSSAVTLGFVHVIHHHQRLIVQSEVHRADVDAQVHVLSPAYHADVTVFCRNSGGMRQREEGRKKG